MNKNNKSFGYIVGQILGAVFVSCVGLCLAGILIALTLKFLLFIF